MSSSTSRTSTNVASPAPGSSSFQLPPSFNEVNENVIDEDESDDEDLDHDPLVQGNSQHGNSSDGEDEVVNLDSDSGLLMRLKLKFEKPCCQIFNSLRSHMHIILQNFSQLFKNFNNYTIIFWSHFACMCPLFDQSEFYC